MVQIHTLKKLLLLWNQKNSIKTQNINHWKSLSQNVPLNQKGLLKMKSKEMRKMLFPLPQIKTKGQVLCYQKLRAESLQWGAVWQESILLWTWLHLPFFPEPFLVNYAQSISVSVIIHFFINSYIFLFSITVVAPMATHSLTFIPWEWPHYCEWKTIEWGSLHLSQFLLRKHVSNWTTHLIANYFDIKCVYICICDQ